MAVPDVLSITSMRSAIHFDEAGSVLRHHDFSMGRTVLESQCIENPTRVADQNLSNFTVGIHRDTTKVDKCVTVGRTLIVHPDHRGLVNTITRDVIDDVFVTFQKFLAWDTSSVDGR